MLFSRGVWIRGNVIFKSTTSRILSFGQCSLSTFGDGTGKKIRNPTEIYNYIARNGRITRDEQQASIVDKLTEIDQQIKAYKPPKVGEADERVYCPNHGHVANNTDNENNNINNQAHGFFARLFGNGSNSNQEDKLDHNNNNNNNNNDDDNNNNKTHMSRPKGLYLYGEPGCGKTFLLGRYNAHVPNILNQSFIQALVLLLIPIHTCIYTYTYIHIYLYVSIHLSCDTYTPIHLYTYTPIHLYIYFVMQTWPTAVPQWV